VSQLATRKIGTTVTDQPSGDCKRERDGGPASVTTAPRRRGEVDAALLRLVHGGRDEL
jgi:hypothetical protein